MPGRKVSDENTGIGYKSKDPGIWQDHTPLIEWEITGDRISFFGAPSDCDKIVWTGGRNNENSGGNL